ncbi:MAG: ATP-binding protein [Candidatus Udaeobacter sp.]
MNVRSIRFRLISRFTVLLLLVMLGFGAFTYWRVRTYIVDVIASSMKHRAQQIAQTMLQDTPIDESYISNEIETRYAPESNDRFIRITRGDGSVLYCSHIPADRSFTPANVPYPKAQTGNSDIREEALPNEAKMVIAAIRYPVMQGSYLVEVGTSLAGADRVISALLWTLAAGLLAIMSLTVLGGWTLMSRALSPVRDITNAARDITTRDLPRRLPVPNTGDEIADLSIVLNQMIGRLQESFENVSRFTADASHELRTPLTIIRGELEGIIAHARLHEDARTSLGTLQEEVERLVMIVQRLFALSRLDMGEAQAERVKFDLARLAATTVDQMSLLAEEKGISLQCPTNGPVQVEGDRTRLKQIIVNLVDNAIKYTPDGGAVEVIVSSKNGTALVEVRDNGPGIPESAIPHIFERFYRVDEVHSRDIEGAGLGLAIVQSIVTAHGGTVSVRNEPKAGCRITVSLPRAN